VDPRASLDDVERRKFLTLSELELRHLGRPARSQSLYRLLLSRHCLGHSSPDNLLLNEPFMELEGSLQCSQKFHLTVF
jgi:hypothetical protein